MSMDMVVEWALLLAEAERLVEERGGSLEGWLWYMARPPSFTKRGDVVTVEYPNLDYTAATVCGIHIGTWSIMCWEEEYGDEER